MLALKDKCLHPTTNTPYLKMAVGGKENSPEGIAVSFCSSRFNSLQPPCKRVLLTDNSNSDRAGLLMLSLWNSRTKKIGSTIWKKILPIWHLWRVLDLC